MILTSTKTSASCAFYHLATHKYINNAILTNSNAPNNIHNRCNNIRNNVGLLKGTQMSIHRLKAVDSGENQNETTEEVITSKLKDTMADLDAILGIEEEKDIEISKQETAEKLKTKIQAEVEEYAKKAIDDKDSKKTQKYVQDMNNVLDAASKLADGKLDENQLRASIEKLIDSLNASSEALASDDIKIVKEKVFDPTVFWVTDTEVMTDLSGGIRFRGNLRMDQEKAFSIVEAKIKEYFGDKYEVFFIEESPKIEDLSSDDMKPKLCFQLVPSATAKPPPAARWQTIIAGVLLFVTIGSTFEVGLASNIGKLPPEFVEYLNNPNSVNPDLVPSFFSNFDVTSYIFSTVPITISILLAQFAHEFGHRIMAFFKKVKLKGSFFIPNSQIGTFGSVTQLDSLVKNKQDLWDISFSGIASGGLISFIFFIIGLIIIQDPNTTESALVPVPSALLESSTLMGSIVQAILGTNVESKIIYLHPLTIAGWCGLTTTAFNLLPVGNLDGGRMMLSAFGRSSLNITSLFTYAGLALGLIGSSLALPFGLYVLICQRDPEIFVKNQVTLADSNRRWLTVVLITLAILILVPLSFFNPSNDIPFDGNFI